LNGTGFWKAGFFLALALALGGATAAVSAGAAGQASEQADKAAKLEALRKKIRQLQVSLGETRNRQQALRQQLKSTEKEIGRLSRSLKKTREQLRRQKQALEHLQVRHQEQQAALARQREALRRQILASYTMGRQGYLKIILNQQDPAQIGRTLAYYDYFNRARAEQIESIQSQLREIAALEAQINHESAALQTLFSQQEAQVQKKEQQRAKRRAVLVKLDREIHTKEQRLQVFLQDEKNLARLLSQLQAVLSDIAPDAGEARPFHAAKGRLLWPAEGKIGARFGSRRKNAGKLRWQGLVINAAEGEAVRSIHAGRVAFADWLRGFGLLVIIDHGKGYMSLYAHNQSLYKSVGEWVSRGEVIATVGSSGGRADPGLYFEIRHNGKPTNPLKWLQARK